MKIANARLRGKPELYEIQIAQTRFTSVTPQAGLRHPEEGEIDAQGRLLCAPFIEPHIHLDAVLTAGEPRWNASGTLFEGIECWAERKPALSREDIRRRALETLELLVGQGVQYVRTHADVSDPSLVGLKTLCELRDTLEAGEPAATCLETGLASLREIGFDPDYLELRAIDLAPITETTCDAVLLAAARLGPTRLIDNLTLTLPR